MNDYKELIEECSHWIEIGDKNECLDITKHLKELKCSIEQLVKERDKLQNDLWEANDIIEYANDMLKKAEKERDAAVEDLFDVADYYGDRCHYCAKDKDKPCIKCKWGWRGVQE